MFDLVQSSCSVEWLLRHPCHLRRRDTAINYKTLMMTKKAAIIRQVESSRPQCEVAQEFSSSKETVFNYLKNKGKILEAVEEVSAGKQKNFCDGSPPKLEEALNMWLNATVAKRIPLSGDLLR
ncbi:hypothetical protein HPB50_015300 [Hyalomma asiaticum]|uniref:Uncharacterized protein n=1 Tax=Hyalomma asiaticum TaxID=266040 RepID=A0ACB7TIJ4_HYAAI|nr:hypothetical protein HPB50_015300 [Hyalomma asiaticum]